MQDNISRQLRKIDYLCAGGIFLVVACSVGAGLLPLYRARAENITESQRLQSEIGKLGDLSLSIGRAQADIRQAEARLSEEEKHLPASDAMDQFMTELAKVAETAGLQVDAIAPHAAMDAGPYKVVPVRITGVGSYETCYKFLTGLRNMSRLTRLDELQLQQVHDDKADPRKPMCEITVSIITFVTR